MGGESTRRVRVRNSSKPGGVARREAREELRCEFPRVARECRSRQGQGGANQVQRGIAVRQRGVVGEERLDAEALQLVREPRRIGEQRARRLDLARAAEMRDEMPQPVDVAQPGKAAVAGLSEMCDEEAVELREAPLDRTLAQQRAHDVVQTQDAAAEIELQQQRQLGQPREQILTVERIERRRLAPEADRDAVGNLGVLDEDGEFREARALVGARAARG